MKDILLSFKVFESVLTVRKTVSDAPAEPPLWRTKSELKT